LIKDNRIMGRFLSILFVTSTLFLTACSTTTSVPGSVKMPSTKGVAAKSITIGEFSGNNRQASDELKAKVTAYINREGFTDAVTSRGQGLLSAKINMGRLNRDSWKTDHEDKDDKTYYRYHAKHSKNLSVSYRYKSGSKIITDVHEASYEDEESSKDGYSEAKRELLSEDKINNKLVKEVARSIAYDLTPHRKAVTFDFIKGDEVAVGFGSVDKNLETGVKYVESKRFPEAESIFQQVIDNTTKPKTRAAAMYNIGLLREMHEDYKSAFEIYADASQIDLASDRYRNAMSRAEQRHANLIIFNQATGQ